jgi:hypothetical protein
MVRRTASTALSKLTVSLPFFPFQFCSSCLYVRGKTRKKRETTGPSLSRVCHLSWSCGKKRVRKRAATSFFLFYCLHQRISHSPPPPPLCTSSLILAHREKESHTKKIDKETQRLGENSDSKTLLPVCSVNCFLAV